MAPSPNCSRCYVRIVSTPLLLWILRPKSTWSQNPYSGFISWGRWRSIKTGTRARCISLLERQSFPRCLLLKVRYRCLVKGINKDKNKKIWIGKEKFVANSKRSLPRVSMLGSSLSRYANHINRINWLSHTPVAIRRCWLQDFIVLELSKLYVGLFKPFNQGHPVRLVSDSWWWREIPLAWCI